MERLGFGGAGGGFGGPAALGAGLPPVADPEAAYATQLEQLQVIFHVALQQPAIWHYPCFISVCRHHWPASKPSEEG